LFAGFSVNGSSPNATTHWSFANAGRVTARVVRKKSSAVTVLVTMGSPCERVACTSRAKGARSLTKDVEDRKRASIDMVPDGMWADSRRIPANPRIRR
jgi:hypothetical protein